MARALHERDHPDRVIIGYVNEFLYFLPLKRERGDDFRVGFVREFILVFHQYCIKLMLSHGFDHFFQPVERRKVPLKVKVQASHRKVRIVGYLHAGDLAAMVIHQLVQCLHAIEQPAVIIGAYVDALFPDIEDMDLAGSLYDLMDVGFGLRPVRATERLEVAEARPSDARTIGAKRGASVLLVERVGYSADGTPVEFSRDRFRADRTWLATESTQIAE